jgi:hypothetical protein
VSGFLSVFVLSQQSRVGTEPSESTTYEINWSAPGYTPDELPGDTLIAVQPATMWLVLSMARNKSAQAEERAQLRFTAYRTAEYLLN